MTLEAIINTGIFLSVFFYLVLAIIWLLVWIFTLIHQARRERWVWFVVTLIFNLTIIVYWFVWMVSKKFRRKKK